LKADGAKLRDDVKARPHFSKTIDVPDKTVVRSHRVKRLGKGSMFETEKNAGIEIDRTYALNGRPWKLG